MRASRRTSPEIEASRRWKESRARIAGQVRSMRLRRRWSQAELARRAGVGPMVVSRVERGEGRLDMELLERFAIVLGVALSVGFGRDPGEEVTDAGHLAMQELVLRLGRANGYTRAFELPTRPSEPWRSADVVHGSDVDRTLIHAECWNTIRDIGAASRSSARKQAELEQLAIAQWGPDAVASMVWVVRDSARNRALVARYPEVFATRFPGSSRAWVRALVHGGPIPVDPGLVWCDVRHGRIYEWRREVGATMREGKAPAATTESARSASLLGPRRLGEVRLLRGPG